MTIITFVQVFTVCLLGAMSPGPSMLIVANNAIFRGKIHGFATALGHGLGITIYAFFAVISLGLLIEKYYFIFQLFQLVSIIFLIYLGTKSLKSKNNFEISSQNTHNKNISFLEGFSISILNPKILIWFTAIYSQFMSQNNENIYNIILIITAGLIDIIWYIVLTLMVRSSLVFKNIQKNFNLLEKFIGIIFIMIAIFLLFKLI